jgi:hypothetical protein
VKTLAHTMAVLGLLLSAGCLCTSIAPLYTDTDVVFEPALLGTWVERTKDAPTESWTFTKSGDKAYRILVVTANDKTVLVGHLLKLDDTLFLDVHADVLESQGVPVALASTLSGWYAPVHLFVRINRITPTLTLNAIDADWLETYLAEHPDALRHITNDHDLLLTATTQELQAFVRAQAKTKGLFADQGELVRKGAPR